jgi:hypothetical protein
MCDAVPMVVSSTKLQSTTRLEGLEFHSVRWISALARPAPVTLLPKKVELRAWRFGIGTQVD